MQSSLVARGLTCPLLRQRLRRAALAPSQGVAAPQPRRLSRAQAESKRGGGGLGDEDIDVAVFRFTLGIPGFEDRFIPRVVGVAIGALLVLNHVLGAEPAPDAQVRAEYLGALLAVLCLFVPDIEERLREAMPGRGRQKAAGAVEGAANCFLLEPSLPEAAKKELAWASFSLLKNTNCCGVVLAAGGRVLMARGAVGAGAVRPGDTAGSLAALGKDLASASGPLAAVASGSSPASWLPERSGFGAAASLPALPAGAQSLYAAHVEAAGGGPGVLVVFSERPRAMADRERGWVAAVAAKLGPFV
ncbi:hypothetical protein HYH03_016190 [Edaphochlamys debaryana]|uniref:CCB2 n=1 Tax=Edaphochlamys debaryana TaxID=47281 RepID=A0A835XLP7_9CHLO|nr:hypothetical protein HYH03_016190 [Edaphochlamys debaryana]|eukprot:KAG2485093.1 hypothetical protein HYH03_016190 [Edaphochlamys debaryana]